MKKLTRFSKEEKKRLFEAFAMVLTAGTLIGLSRLESRLYELSARLSQNQEFITSTVYFGLINLNVILILLLSFLILRNVVKLVVERRRGVLGSRLRSKLVVTLVFFALLPTVLLFYISSKFITTSYDKWFSQKVRDTMTQTREAGTLVYKQDQRRLESLARIALQRIDVARMLTPSDPFAVDHPLIQTSRLEGFDLEYRLDVVRVYNRDGQIVWGSDGAADHLVKDVFVLTAIERFIAQAGLVSMSTVEAEEKRDVVKGIAPLHEEGGSRVIGAVLAVERFETSILRSIEAILADFADFRPGVQLIRMSNQILLIVITLLIVFSASWLGFYVAREITGPIQSLAEATREVAAGNYNITLEAKSDDETGTLVRSFNLMTKDLQRQKAEVEQSQTRLQIMNEELERRRKYMEVVLASVSTGVISVDKEERLASVNKAAEKLLHLRANSVGRPIQEGLSKELVAGLWRPIVERLGDQETCQTQLEIEIEQKLYTFLVNAARIRDDDAKEVGFVVVVDDATQQVQAQRVAAWREVARRIAHEIKNPLTPIKLNAQRLLRRFNGSFEGENRQVFETCIETILQQVDSLRNLVNEFSKFSRLPGIQPRPGDLNEVVNAVVDFFQSSYAEITFDRNRLGAIPLCNIDKEQINRVFVNIVTNAVAAVEGCDEAPRVIEFSTQFVDALQAVRVEVSDSGPGIPQKIRDRVFEPYFSTKKEGTGLGLAIVSQIVADHGGYVRVSDHQPRGTTVTIDIPIETSHGLKI